MSWSVNAVGKPAVVAAKIAVDIAKVKCAEPEETIKNKVGSAIAAALAAFPPGLAVRVEAAGSQWAPEPTKKPTEFQNSLSVKLEPLHGFVE